MRPGILTLTTDFGADGPYVAQIEWVHLAVEDPGVGTDRRLIVDEARDAWFVLPDHGPIAGVLDGHEPSGTWEIRKPMLRRAVVDGDAARLLGSVRGTPVVLRRRGRVST